MAIFSSRPPFNDDPKPWLHTHGGENCRDTGGRFSFNNGIGNEHAPRAEFDRPKNNPTSPILVAFREYSDKHGMDADDRRNLARAWLQAPRYYEGRLVAGRVLKAPRDHARRVLSRLARFKEESA